IAKANSIDVLKNAVYWQSKGPRFETKAEVKMISNFADIVGMTMASEATLARELKIPYANISIIDNLAHGLGKLTIEQVEKFQEKSTREIIPNYINAIMEGFT
ncbi:MAG: hypothetical protein ACQESF_03970, partial [Nanobdellota archaeon]